MWSGGASCGVSISCAGCHQGVGVTDWVVAERDPGGALRSDQPPSFYVPGQERPYWSRLRPVLWAAAPRTRSCHAPSPSSSGCRFGCRR